MGTTHYLIPVSQTPDAPFIVRPSRLFPWVGVGYPLITVLVLPGLAALMTYLGTRDLNGFDGSPYGTALTVIPFIQIVALAWGAVHAIRLGRVRHRLGASLVGVIPPPRDYINMVQLDDAAFYRRDDRSPTVKTLVRWQARVMRFGDEANNDPSSWSSPEELARDFADRQRPRKGLMPGTILLTCLGVPLMFVLLAAAGPTPTPPAAVGAVAGLDALQIGVLFTIAGIRNSLDTAFRKRILELRGRAG